MFAAYRSRSWSIFTQPDLFHASSSVRPRPPRLPAPSSRCNVTKMFAPCRSKAMQMLRRQPPRVKALIALEADFGSSRPRLCVEDETRLRRRGEGRGPWLRRRRRGGGLNRRSSADRPGTTGSTRCLVVQPDAIECPGRRGRQRVARRAKVVEPDIDTRADCSARRHGAGRAPAHLEEPRSFRACLSLPSRSAFSK